MSDETRKASRIPGITTYKAPGESIVKIDQGNVANSQLFLPATDDPSTYDEWGNLFNTLTFPQLTASLRELKSFLDEWKVLGDASILKSNSSEYSIINNNLKTIGVKVGYSKLTTIDTSKLFIHGFNKEGRPVDGNAFLFLNDDLTETANIDNPINATGTDGAIVKGRATITKTALGPINNSFVNQLTVLIIEGNAGVYTPKLISIPRDQINELDTTYNFNAWSKATDSLSSATSIATDLKYPSAPTNYGTLYDATTGSAYIPYKTETNNIVSRTTTGWSPTTRTTTAPATVNNYSIKTRLTKDIYVLGICDTALVSSKVVFNNFTMFPTPVSFLSFLLMFENDKAFLDFRVNDFKDKESLFKKTQDEIQNRILDANKIKGEIDRLVRPFTLKKQNEAGTDLLVLEYFNNTANAVVQSSFKNDVLDNATAYPVGLATRKRFVSATLLANDLDEVWYHGKSSAKLLRLGIAGSTSATASELLSGLKINGDLLVSNNTALNGTLSVVGLSSFTGNVTLTGDLAVNGGDLTTTSVTFNLLTSVASTINAFSGATALNLGAITVSGTHNYSAGATVSGQTKTINLGTNGLAGSTTAITIGAAAGNSNINLVGNNTNTGTLTVTGATALSSTLSVVGLVTLTNDLIINGGDLSSTAGTFHLFDTVGTTTVNAFGQTTTLNLGYDNTLAGSTTNINNGALASGSTKTINIGTSGLSGSITNITLGSGVTGALGVITANQAVIANKTLLVAGLTTLSDDLFVNGENLKTTAVSFNLINDTAKTINAFGIAEILNLANETVNSQVISFASGATLSGNTKTINIGTAGVSGSTTNIKIGSGLGSGTITLDQITSISKTLSVSGITTLSNNLNVTGTTTLKGTTAHTGNTTTSGTTTLTGLLTANGGLATTTGTFSTTLSVTGAVSLSSTLSVVGNTTLTGELAINGGDLTSTAGTFNLLSSFTNQINAFSASASISIGGNVTASQNIVIGNGATVSGQTKTISIGRNGAVGSTTNIEIGSTIYTTNINTYGTHTHTGSKTISTTLTVAGSTTLSSTLAVTGLVTMLNNLTVNGGDLTTTATTFNLLDTIATTVNSFGSTTLLNIGYDGTTAASTTNINSCALASGLTKTINFGSGSLSGATTNINFGSSVSGALGTINLYQNTILNKTLLVTGLVTLSGDLIINGGDLTTSAATFNLINTVSTTINFAGTATLVNVGGTTDTAVINVGVGATLSGNTKTLNFGTGAAVGASTIINLGSSTGSSTLNIFGNSVLNGTLSVTGDSVLAGNLALNGGHLTSNATNFELLLFGLTQVKAFSSIPNIYIGGDLTTTQTIGIGNGATVSGSTKTINIGNGGLSGSATTINVGTSAGTSAINLTGSVALSSTLNVTGHTTLVGNLYINGGSLLTTSTTFNLLETVATTVNAFGPATLLDFGGSTATLTTNIQVGATVSGATKTINVGQNGVAGSTTILNFGSAAGTSTINTYGTHAHTGNVKTSGTTVLTGLLTANGGVWTTGGTFSTTLSVTGNTTLTGLLTANGGIVASTNTINTSFWSKGSNVFDQLIHAKAAINSDTNIIALGEVRAKKLKEEYLATGIEKYLGDIYQAKYEGSAGVPAINLPKETILWVTKGATAYGNIGYIEPLNYVSGTYNTITKIYTNTEYNFGISFADDYLRFLNDSFINYPALSVGTKTDFTFYLNFNDSIGQITANTAYEFLSFANAAESLKIGFKTNVANDNLTLVVKRNNVELVDTVTFWPATAGTKVAGEIFRDKTIKDRSVSFNLYNNILSVIVGSEIVASYTFSALTNGLTTLKLGKTTDLSLKCSLKSLTLSKFTTTEWSNFTSSWVPNTTFNQIVQSSEGKFFFNRQPDYLEVKSGKVYVSGFNSNNVYSGNNTFNGTTTFTTVIASDLTVDNNISVSGDLKMAGTDSYIWSPTTTSGFTGFWDGFNSKIALKYKNDVGLGILGEPTVGNALTVTGNTTLTGDLAVNGGDLTTTATTFNLLNTNATTVNAFAAATSLTIGVSTATSSNSLIGGATVSGATKNIYIGANGLAGSTTNIYLGSASSTSTTTVLGNLVNAGVVNFTGATNLTTAVITTGTATTLGVTTANLATANVTGALNVSGTTSITGSSTTIGNSSSDDLTINATSSIVGPSTFAGTLTSTGGLTASTASITTATVGTLAVTGNTTLTGDLAVNGGDITTISAVATLFNSNATTITIGTAATSTGLAQGIMSLTLGLGNGSTVSGATKTVYLGTHGAAGSITNIYIGTTLGNSTIYTRGTLDHTGDLFASGVVSAAALTIKNTDPTNGYGISLHSGTSSVTNGMYVYGLAFTGTATQGTHGTVTSNWATYFTTDATPNRGWIFRNVSTAGSAGNVASIDNVGNATFNKQVDAESFKTGAATIKYNTTTKSLDFNFA